jgi:hypothetical protein
MQQIVREEPLIPLPGPDPRAATRGFVALSLDLARLDPDRAATKEMRAWAHRIADDLGIPPTMHLPTNRALLREALRLEAIAHDRVNDTTRPPERILSDVA